MRTARLKVNRRLTGLGILIGVIVLPLLGAVVSNRDSSELFRFPPPLEIPSSYPRFSWFAAIGVVVTLATFAMSWILGARPVEPQSNPPAQQTPRGRTARFPMWGWAALLWTLVWWVLAWSRWSWFEGVQRFTFFPLWIGFIVTVNALTHRRANTCLMQRSPRGWLTLFGASALFWWSFEWLNRFVHNWHYMGVEDFGALGYAVHASLCFSTVLPAVAAVAEWLGTYPRWLRRTSTGPAWRWIAVPRVAVALCFAGVGGLVLTGAFPERFYPALWLAPLMLLIAEPVLKGRHGLAHEMSRGDWGRAATWMVAALICGFFWELWNWKSLAKWIYTVPGVERWHIFEMPLLGYAGYLPFGLECLLVIDRLTGIQLRAFAPTCRGSSLELRA